MTTTIQISVSLDTRVDGDQVLTDALSIDIPLPDEIPAADRESVLALAADKAIAFSRLNGGVTGRPISQIFNVPVHPADARQHYAGVSS